VAGYGSIAAPGGAAFSTSSMKKNATSGKKEVGSVILVRWLAATTFWAGSPGVNKIGGGDFDQHDLDLLTLLASQIATAIDKQQP